MPLVRITQRFPYPQARVVDFFRRPANIVAVAPPELQLQLIEAPAVVAIGARIVVDVRRWGIRQRITTEVVHLDEERIIEEQKSGPFRRWRHTRRFTAIAPEEMDLEEEIDFEPPGGMLGLVMTAARVESDLLAALESRRSCVLEMLARSS